MHHERGSGRLTGAPVPMIGGMVSSTLLTLIVLPAIFGLHKGARMPRRKDDDVRSGVVARSGPVPR
jgi:Cu/Ag efflux pump CusA